MVETNIIEGFKNNVIGTINCAKSAIKADVKNFILISTDKAVNPTSVMGATKRFAEQIIQSLAEKNAKIGKSNIKFNVVRFGNVLGSSGSVVPLFKEQISKGGPVTVTSRDVTRYFMTIEEASQLVIQAGAIGKTGNLFVLDMGEPIKIIDLAKKMISLTGQSPKMPNEENGDIEITITGLNKGEKPFEELTIDNALIRTSNPKIFQVNDSFIKWDDLERLINKFSKSLTENNINKVKKLLHEVIPSYKTNINDHGKLNKN